MKSVSLAWQTTRRYCFNIHFCRTNSTDVLLKKHENINNKLLSLRYKTRVYPDERVEIRLDWESDRKGTGISLKFAFHLPNADPRIK